MSASPSLRAPLTLVGRDRELGVLRQHLAAALAGHGSLVLIGGEAGIGKTALAEALCREAAEQGALVFVGRCFDLTETPPYGPWIYLFDAYTHDVNLPDRPPAFARRGSVGAISDQGALFQQVRDFTEQLTAQRPIVLLLDDLHWSDSASLDLLRFLAQSIARLPALLLVTYRSDELTRHPPLYQLLPRFVREAGADRVDVHPLTDNAVRVLVARHYALSETETNRLVTYLQTRSEGNALFLGELLRSLEEADVLRQDETGWTLGDLSRVTIPALLRQVIDGRVARLDVESQRLLAVAAIIGYEVPLTVWAAVVEAEEDALLDMVERSAEARLLSEMPDGERVQFAHALIREALYEGIPATRRRRLHRAVGEVLSATRDPDPDAVANHFRRAGDMRAAEWLVKAGRRAAATFSSWTVVERFEAALAVYDERDLDPLQRAYALPPLVFAYRFIDHKRALDYAAEAIHAAKRLNDPALLARTLIFRAWTHQDVGNLHEGLDDLAAAKTLIDTLTAEEHAAFARLAGYDFSGADGGFTEYLAICGEFIQAREVGERFVADAPAALDTVAPTVARGRRVALGNCYFGLQLAYLYQGEPERAARATTDARFWYGALSWDMMLGFVAQFELAAALTYGADRIEERQRLADAQDAWHGRWFETLGIPYLRLGQLHVLEIEGEWSAAQAIASQFVGPTMRGVPSFPRLTLASIARAQGEPEVAWSLVGELLPDGPATAILLPYWDHSRALRLGATLALDADDLTAARAWLDAYEQSLARCGAVVGQSEGQALWARYFRMVGDAERAHAHAERAFRHASEPRQPLALLAAHRLLGELDTETGRHEDAAAHLDISLALAQACQSPYERALTLLAMAELRAATGQETTAMTLLNEVRTICTPLGAKPALTRADIIAAHLRTPAPSRAAVFPAGLTAREVEVLQLVAVGLMNAEIAERLFLSERTVEQHLRSVYNKLGSSSRTAATRFAVEHHLT